MHNEINIFEGAKFGDTFITKCGLKVSYAHLTKTIEGYIIHWLLLDAADNAIIGYEPNGISIGDDTDDYNIVSKYHKEIDEEKLDELARKMADDYESEVIKQFGNCNCESIAFYYRGVKSGYRKAKEE